MPIGLSTLTRNAGTTSPKTAFTTASVSPAADSIVILQLGCFLQSGTLTGWSITQGFSIVGSWTVVIYPAGSGAKWAWAWARCHATAPGSGTVTATRVGTGNIYYEVWNVTQITGFDTASPFGTVVTGESGQNLSSYSVDISTPEASSASIGLVWCHAADSPTAGSGMTELSEQNGPSSFNTLQVVYDDTAPGVTVGTQGWNASTDYIYIAAFEIKAAAVASSTAPLMLSAAQLSMLAR